MQPGSINSGSRGFKNKIIATLKYTGTIAYSQITLKPSYGEEIFAVNLKYPSKAIQEAKSAVHALVLLKMDYLSC